MLTPGRACDNIIKSRAEATRQAAVAQSVERRIGSAEVTGPIPVSSWIEETETLVEKVSVSFRKGHAAH